MADAAGSGISKKIGPLPVWGWAASGGAALILWRIIQARRAAAAANAGLGLTDSQTLPSTATTPTAGGSASSFSSYGQWETAALAELAGNGLNGADALNAVNAWLGGQCVSSSAFQAISALLTTTGPPPGYGAQIPSLSVCASSTTPTGTPGPPSAPPATLPTWLQNAMVNNGEHIVDVQWDPVTQAWVWLTNKGGIYAPSNSFFGSIMSNPQATQWVVNGQQFRQAAKLTIRPDGGYTITDTRGETYNYFPGDNIPGASATAVPGPSANTSPYPAPGQ